MDNRNPARFYFWAHSEIEELETVTAREVIAKSEVIFREFVTPKYDSQFKMLSELERDLNDYSQRGKLSLKFKSCLKNSQERIFLGETKGTPKRYVFERTHAFEDSPAEEDLNEWVDQISRGFLENGLESVKENYLAFLKASRDYHFERELDVASQINSIPENVAVFFGAGHLRLEKLVAEKRSTEIYFPYGGYEISFGTRLQTKFDNDGTIDWNIFLKERMEEIARAAIRKSYGEMVSQRELDLAARYYANIIPPEKVKEYQEFLKFAVQFNQGPGEVFSSFIKREGLPNIETVTGKSPAQAKSGIIVFPSVNLIV